MIKVVVAYIDSNTFEPVRRDLAAEGIVSISVIAAGGASADRFVAPHYHGSPQTMGLTEKLRLECVVGASHVELVKEAILRHEGKRTFLFVMNVEEATPDDSVVSDAGEAVAESAG